MPANSKRKLNSREFNRYFFLLAILLIVCYSIGFIKSGAYELRNIFSTKIVMSTAQIARNNIQGNYLETKYILPVSYAFFPTIEHHPDFVRPLFPILIYTILFLITSPGAIIVKMLSAFLFLFNGCLIYWFVLRLMGHDLMDAGNKIPTKDRIIAILVSVCSSVFYTEYFIMALQDYYEIIAYTMMLITLHVVIGQKTRPVILGGLYSLMYLTKPNMVVFAIVFTVYILFFKTRPTLRVWLKTGTLCILGFVIIQAPFLIRSYYYTGDPFFSIQKKVNIVRWIVSAQNQNQVYKSFITPPSLLETALNNLPRVFSEWKYRTIKVLKYLLSLDKLVFWFGLILFYIKFTKSRKLLFSYLLFLVFHVVFMALVIELSDTVRTYRILFDFIVVLAFVGYFSVGADLFMKIPLKTQRASIILLLLLLPVFTYLLDDINDCVNSVGNIPNSIAKDIRELDPGCLYSNSPYEASWYLDIPTIYAPADYSEMLDLGPEECNYFFYVDKEDENLEGFLEENGTLVYQNLEFFLYEFNS